MASSRKSNLAEVLAADLGSRLPSQTTLCAGLSGGLDSVVLLHLLHDLAGRFGWPLSACHVHHGLSSQADHWADFCRHYCALLGVPLHVERVEVAPLRKALGVEAAARQLRRSVLFNQSCDYVVLAHHADDQAETVLLQLLRGAGVKGAAAMPFCQTGSGRPGVLRPLLAHTRAQLLDYAEAHGLDWVEDGSNADEHYPRNLLRHRVMPILRSAFPSCAHTLGRSAAHFAEAESLLETLAEMDAGAGWRADRLELSVLQNLPAPRARNVLRAFLRRAGAPMPHAAQLEALLPQLLDARPDADPQLHFGGWQMRRYRSAVYVVPPLPPLTEAWDQGWQGEKIVSWPLLAARIHFEPCLGAGISLARLRSGAVQLRLRGGGERMRPHPKAATRSLKHLFQEMGVPPWQRERLPLLYCDQTLVSVGDLAVAADFQAQPGEAGILLRLEPAGDFRPEV